MNKCLGRRVVSANRHQDSCNGEQNPPSECNFLHCDWTASQEKWSFDTGTGRSPLMRGRGTECSALFRAGRGPGASGGGTGPNSGQVPRKCLSQFGASDSQAFPSDSVAFTIQYALNLWHSLCSIRMCFFDPDPLGLRLLALGECNGVARSGRHRDGRTYPSFRAEDDWDQNSKGRCQPVVWF